MIHRISAWQYHGGATPIWRKKHFLLIFYGRVEGFWLFGFYDISRRPLLSYSKFQGVKLKLRSWAFFWGMDCFSTSNCSFRVLKTTGFRKWLSHPVRQISNTSTYRWNKESGHSVFRAQWMTNHFSLPLSWPFATFKARKNLHLKIYIKAK